MTSSSMELDIIVERSAYFPDSIRKDKLCDYYQEFHKEGKLLVSFTNLLVRMYVNYVLNCLLELDLTLREERILLDWVYTFASDLMYEFLRASYLLLMNFLICAVQSISILVGVVTDFQGKNSIMGLINKDLWGFDPKISDEGT